MTHWAQEILTRLEKYSGFEVARDSESLSVICDCEGSFEVSIYRNGDGFQVGYDGWHEDFEDLEQALDCFTFGLSDQCRLKVKMRGETDTARTLQSKTPTHGKIFQQRG